MRFFAVLAILACSGVVFGLDFRLQGVQQGKNSLLAPIRAGMAIQSYSDTTNPPVGNTLLRKKLPEGGYTLYEGRLESNSWKDLTAFYPSDFNAWRLFLDSRFYSSSPSDSSQDLSELYWSGSALLVPGAIDTLFAVTPHGTAAFLAVAGKPVSVQVMSEPRNGVVFVNGKPLGTTPMAFQWLQGNLLRVRIEKLGYYTYENIIEADPNDPLVLDISLRESPTFRNGYQVDPGAYDAHGTMDYLQVESMIAGMTKNALHTGTAQALELLESYLDTLKNRQYTEFIGPEKLSVADWDSAQGGIPIRLRFGEHDFDFGFEGVLPCNFEESLHLKDLLKPTRKSNTLKSSLRSRRISWPSAPTTANLDGWIRLKYRNWATDARSNSRSVRRYFALDALELVLEDQTIPLPGDFVPAHYIQQSEDWKEYLESMQ